MNEKEQEILCTNLAHLMLDYEEAYDWSYYHYYEGFIRCMKVLGYKVEKTFDFDCLIDGFKCNGKYYKLADYKEK